MKEKKVKLSVALEETLVRFLDGLPGESRSEKLEWVLLHVKEASQDLALRRALQAHKGSHAERREHEAWVRTLEHDAWTKAVERIVLSRRDMVRLLKTLKHSPKPTSALLAAARRYRGHKAKAMPGPKTLDAAYKAAGKEKWRRQLSDDWGLMDTREWPS